MNLFAKSLASAACAAVLLCPLAASAVTPPLPSDGKPAKWARSIPFALAKEAAEAALACAEKGGSRTSVGVMDISGHFKVLYTPDAATLVGYDVLIKKMNAALLRQKETSAERALTVPPARYETDTLSNVMERIAPGMALISPGGVPLFAGKDFVGVIGVAGASTPGDLDTVCAQAGADKIKDRLK